MLCLLGALLFSFIAVPWSAGIEVISLGSASSMCHLDNP
jgi:hypothetical protein